MKRLTIILLITYYFSGVFFLPQGDFSVLMDIPSMYNHCKITEDKDLTIFDFITDHLVNIDSLFDKHDKGDAQKPHAPVQFHQTISPAVYIVQEHTLITSTAEIIYAGYTDYCNDIYLSDYTSTIFRPPIVSIT